MLLLAIAALYLAALIGLILVLRAAKDILWLPSVGISVGVVGGLIALKTTEVDRLTDDLFGVLGVSCFALLVAFTVSLRVVGRLPDPELDKERTSFFIGVQLGALASAVISIVAAYRPGDADDWLLRLVAGTVTAELCLVAVLVVVLAAVPASDAHGNVQTFKVRLYKRATPPARVTVDVLSIAAPMLGLVIGVWSLDTLGVALPNPEDHAVVGAIIAGCAAAIFVLFAAGAPSENGGRARAGGWIGFSLVALGGLAAGIAVVYEPHGWYYSVGWLGCVEAALGALVLGRRSFMRSV